MKIAVVELTPKLAMEWQEKVNPEKQRKFRPSHAQKLAGAMSRNEFTMNNDMFMFGKNGLENGQHRCAAVIKSGKTISVVVATDCSEDEIKHADQGGLPRKTADFLHYSGVENSVHLTAIMNLVKCEFNQDRFTLTADEAAKFYENNKDCLRACLYLWGRAASSGCPVEPSMICALHFMASDKVKASEFCERVSDCVTTAKKDPIWHLLKRFRDSRENISGKMTRDLKVAILIKAYQLFLTGQEIPFLRWSPGQNEQFPIVP